MVFAMMNPTMQIVTLMVGIAVESVSTQTFVLNVYVMKKLNRKLTILVSSILLYYTLEMCSYIYFLIHINYLIAKLLFCFYYLIISDESEPSWLELNNFQLGS